MLMLLELGANASAQDSFGLPWTLSLLQCFILDREYPSHVFGDTPLHVACRCFGSKLQGYADLAYLLVKHGANPALENDKGQLAWACDTASSEQVSV